MMRMIELRKAMLIIAVLLLLVFYSGCVKQKPAVTPTEPAETAPAIPAETGAADGIKDVESISSEINISETENIGQGIEDVEKALE